LCDISLASKYGGQTELKNKTEERSSEMLSLSKLEKTICLEDLGVVFITHHLNI